MKKIINITIVYLLISGFFLKATVRAESGPIIQFQDDFSASDTVSWDIAKSSMRNVDNALISDVSIGNTRAEISGKTTMWDNVNLTFDYTPLELTSTGFMNVCIRENEVKNTTLLFRENSVNYLDDNGWEKACFKYDFANNMTYNISIKAQGQIVGISIMCQGVEVKNNIYTNSCQSGKIAFGSSSTKIKIDNVKVYNLSVPKLYFKDKIVKIDRNSSKVIKPIYDEQNVKSLTYETDNTANICVNSMGEITSNFSSQGSSVITVRATMKDGTMLTDSYDVKVQIPLESTGFDVKIKTLYVGESANIRAEIRPYNATQTKLIWVNENPESIELIGDFNNARGVLAKSITEKARISLRNCENVEIDHFVFQVIQRVTTGKTLEFSPSASREIPKDYFGMCSADWLSMLGNTKEKAPFIQRANMLQGYLGEINTHYVRAILDGYDWKTGKKDNQITGYTPYMLKDIFEMPNNLGVPMCLAVNTADSVEKILTMVAEIQKVSNFPLYLEVGNETYDIGYVDKIPTVEDFIVKTRAIYNGVKKIDTNIKVAIPILDYGLSTTFENSVITGNEYNQTIRGKTWNSYIAKNSDCYDAVVIHSYSNNSLKYASVDDLMESFSASSSMIDFDVTTQSSDFKNKEFWITEFGDLPAYFYDFDSESEKARLQYMKSLGNAIGYAQKILTLLENNNVTKASYHYFNDSQGFGTIQSSSDLSATTLPSFYVFKRIGELLKKYDHIYKIDSNSIDNDVFYKSSVWSGNTETLVGVKRVTSFGFGSKNSIDEVMFCNTSAYPLNVSIPKKSMHLNWKYGNENPLPQFATTTKSSWLDLPTQIPIPEICVDDFSEFIVVPPYSVVVASVKNSDQTSKICNAIAVLYNENMVVCDVVVGEIINDVFNFNGSFKKEGTTVKIFVMDNDFKPESIPFTYERE